MTPYDVLGVDSNASEEQIKQAYRQKALLLSGGNYSATLNEVAKAKMDELDKAYDTILLERNSTAPPREDASAAYRSEDVYDHGDFSQSEGAQFGDIRAKINAGRLDDAEMLLDGVPKAKRTGEWYYLKGTILHRRGWFEDASRNFNTAYSMNPDNAEYKAARDRCEYNRKGKYNETPTSNGCCSPCSPCSICSGLMIADCCCDCC